MKKHADRPCRSPGRGRLCAQMTLEEKAGELIRGLDSPASAHPTLAARLAEGPEIYGNVHWGLNTYTDREWGFGNEMADTYPENLGLGKPFPEER